MQLQRNSKPSTITETNLQYQIVLTKNNNPWNVCEDISRHRSRAISKKEPEAVSQSG